MSDSLRLDVWLDVACLYRTRSEAKWACEGGKVAVNGERARPHRILRSGDRLRITRPMGRFQDVVVQALLDQHVKKADARTLYDDVTPPPSEAEVALRRQDRIYQAAARAAGTPDRRQRRTLRRYKEGE